MWVHLPIPYRLAATFKKRQKAVYALAEWGSFEVAELNDGVTRHSFLTDAGFFELFEHHGVAYRSILDRGRQMSLDELKEVAPSRLFYDWAAPAPLALEDHPSACNVTFEPDLPSKWPVDERPVGSGWSIAEATSVQNLDTRLPDSYQPIQLNDYAMIEGQLVRRMESGTVTFSSDKGRRKIADWTDIPGARVPFKAHFGQPHIEKFNQVMTELSRHEPTDGLASMTIQGLASAEVAARRTLISATAAMLSRLSGIKFGRVPAQEMDIVWHCRVALSGADDPAATAGILESMSRVLRRSPDVGLRDLGMAIAFRAQIIGGGGAIDDEELLRAFT